MSTSSIVVRLTKRIVSTLPVLVVVGETDGRCTVVCDEQTARDLYEALQIASQLPSPDDSEVV